MANSNTNKSKNWMYRLRHLRIRRRSADSVSNDDFALVVYQRNLSYDADTTNCSRSKSSFRNSLRKMHTRVKSVFKNRSSSCHMIHISSVPTSSQSQSRVTLNTTPIHRENIYSLDPVTQTSSESVEYNRLEDTNSSLVEDTTSSISIDSIALPSRSITKRNFPQLYELDNVLRVPKNEIVSLSSYYWYWGPISRVDAEERLSGFPDGAFLIRDSSSDRYIFTMSFRSVGRTLHTRIELSKNGYSLFDQGGYHSIAELVNDALTKSKNGVYCYTKSRDDVNPNYPVRLTSPVSRYDKVPSLKHLSRFVIRQCLNINDIEKLPLPLPLISYLQGDGPYF